MINKAFSLFYDTEVKIYRITRNSSYSEAADTEFVTSVMADVQPMGSGVEEREFGLSVKKELKLFCADADIREGDYAEADGEMYRVISLKRWKEGLEINLNWTGETGGKIYG